MIIGQGRVTPMRGTHHREAKSRPGPDQSMVISGTDHQATLTLIEGTARNKAGTTFVKHLKRSGKHVSFHACLISLCLSSRVQFGHL
jgi:hypothetical protein